MNPHQFKLAEPARAGATIVQPAGNRAVRILLMLLAVHASMLAWSATRHSPTLNEPAHLAAGISHWTFGRFDLYRVNPPLVRLVAALPVMAVGVETDWSEYSDAPGVRPDFEVGREFVTANGERTLWLMVYARWICIPFSMIGACVCFHWAREAFGDAAGVLSATLWCFLPDVLGHGQLITADIAAASLSAAATYAYWRWLWTPTWRRAAVSGILLGVALLTKTMLIILAPLWLFFWIAALGTCSSDERGDKIRQLGMLLLQGVIAIYVLNLGYFLDRPWTRLGDFQFVSQAMAGRLPPGEPVGNRFAGSWIGSIPIPLPHEFVLGLDVQKKDFEAFGRPSYLRGEFRDRGWWYYYLYAAAVKLPLGLWMLMAITAGVIVRPSFSRSHTKPIAPPPIDRRNLLLLGTPAAILVLVSSQTGFNHHFRYVLPAMPPLIVWTSQIAGHFHRSKKTTGLSLFAIAWTVASSLYVYPHSLSYFNELVGGPRHGADHLINSNIDWSQDLWKLKRWLTSNANNRPLRMAYDGYFDAAALGVNFSLPPQRSKLKGNEVTLSPGLYAVSVNFLRGYPFGLSTGKGGMGYAEAYDFSYFRKLEPSFFMGYSIYVYDVGAPLTLRLDD